MVPVVLTAAPRDCEYEPQKVASSGLTAPVAMELDDDILSKLAETMLGPASAGGGEEDAADRREKVASLAARLKSRKSDFVKRMVVKHNAKA